MDVKDGLPGWRAIELGDHNAVGLVRGLHRPCQLLDTLDRFCGHVFRQVEQVTRGLLRYNEAMARRLRKNIHEGDGDIVLEYLDRRGVTRNDFREDVLVVICAGQAHAGIPLIVRVFARP